jgi:tripartite-type tricarboxylate transporter receptor subunit TctC
MRLRVCQDMRMKQPALRVALAALAVAATVAAARAQEQFPGRPIQVIVPATPGGPVDTGVRMIEPTLAAALGQPVVLLSRPGASGTLGMQDVANAAPDGYTIGQGVNSIFTVTRISGTTVTFTLDNFTLLGNYATDVSVLAVNAAVPWRTLDDLVRDVRASPGKLTYASAGVGTVSALSMAALAHDFKLDMVAVPFQGGAQLTAAILGRQVDIGMVPYTTGGLANAAHDPGVHFKDRDDRPVLAIRRSRGGAPAPAIQICRHCYIEPQAEGLILACHFRNPVDSHGTAATMIVPITSASM